MKSITKVLASALCAGLLTCCITACSDSSVNIDARVNLNGSEIYNTQISTDNWAIEENMEITSTHKAMFATAVGELDGYMYEPVALLATKSGSGTTYCFLSKGTVVTADPATSLKLTYIKLDDNGNASFVKDEDIVLPGTGDGMSVGSWTNADSIEITDDIKAVVDEATETLTGATYVPVAYMGSQVVAGTNHAIFCKVVPSTAGGNSDAAFAIVYIYEDLEGNCEITSTEDVDI